MKLIGYNEIQKKHLNQILRLKVLKQSIASRNIGS